MTLKDELIAALENEENRFDMSRWSIDEFEGKTATCETACCMAGWIEALRPELAASLAPDRGEFLDHASLAAEIWEHEMGERCRLDFMGDRSPRGLASRRSEAIDHIRGTSKTWPLLERGR